MAKKGGGGAGQVISLGNSFRAKMIFIPPLSQKKEGVNFLCFFFAPEYFCRVVVSERRVSVSLFLLPYRSRRTRVCAVLSSAQSRRLPLEKVLQRVLPPVSCTPRCLAAWFSSKRAAAAAFQSPPPPLPPATTILQKKGGRAPSQNSPPPLPPPHSAISKSITNFMAYTRTDGCGIPRALKGPVDRAFLKMKIVKLLRSYLFFLFFKDENTSRQFSPTFCAFFL